MIIDIDLNAMPLVENVLIYQLRESPQEYAARVTAEALRLAFRHAQDRMVGLRRSTQVRA